ncbi:MAG: SH3 domain-containing protein, partial [Lachnospiraceae bacterium]
SDSEEADRLGRAEIGTVLECREQKLNGWSEVVFEGQIGYIKSEYLILLGNEELASDVTVIGSVTITDTVNIRASASVDGARVGTAYAGETFDLVERGTQWCKIIYNGTVAYVKTEYTR